MIYTPGHTDDSYSFAMEDRVFTGDTLLIRGTGRTDFQNGDPRQQYEFIFNRLLRLHEDTLVFPAHDYKGDTVSTIGEEKRNNPRLQVPSVDDYVELMNSLNLPNPKMMDVAVPANMQIGLHQEEVAARGWAVNADAALRMLGGPTSRWSISARASERERDGTIPGAAAPALYARLADNVGAGGLLHRARRDAGARLLLRLWRALGDGGEAAHEAGLAGAVHLDGGIAAWKKAGGTLV